MDSDTEKPAEGNSSQLQDKCDGSGYSDKIDKCYIQLTLSEDMLAPFSEKVINSPGTSNHPNCNKDDVDKPNDVEDTTLKTTNNDTVKLSVSNILSTPKPGCSKDTVLDDINDFTRESSVGSDSYFKDNRSISNFQKGVLCSSTPVHAPPAKKLKRDFDHLSAIEEVDCSNDSDNTIVESILVRPAEVMKQTLFEERSLQKTKNKATIQELSSHLLSASSSPENKCLRKDELSMIIDNPECKVSCSKELTVNDQNNVTLKINGNETIVYKNVEDKTIDELYLGVIDHLELDHEPNREEIIQKAENLKVFVSKDEEENKDNNDPEWELHKKLETDDERYKAVRKLWMNLTIPDPKDNLTSFNWRTKNYLGRQKNIELLKSTDNFSGTSGGQYHCTEVFERAIDNLKRVYEARRWGNNIDLTFEYDMWASMNKNNKMPMNRDHYQPNVEELYAAYQERLHRNYIAIQEVEAVHKFYNGLKNQDNTRDLMTINGNELKEIVDVDTMITSYSRCYR